MAKQITRRELLGQSLMAAALGLPLVGQATVQTAARLEVLVASAHPDDPESGCGGAMALYSDLGHDVSNVYLMRGEAGIRGKSERRPRPSVPANRRRPAPS